MVLNITWEVANKERLTIVALVRGEELEWLRLFEVGSLVAGGVWLANERQLAHAASFCEVYFF